MNSFSELNSASSQSLTYPTDGVYTIQYSSLIGPIGTHTWLEGGQNSIKRQVTLTALKNATRDILLAVEFDDVNQISNVTYNGANNNIRIEQTGPLFIVYGARSIADYDELFSSLKVTTAPDEVGPITWTVYVDDQKGNVAQWPNTANVIEAAFSISPVNILTPEATGTNLYFEITDVSVTTHYTLDISVLNTTKGQLLYNGVLGDSWSISGQKSEINSILSLGQLTYKPIDEYVGSSTVNYTITRTGDGAISPPYSFTVSTTENDVYFPTLQLFEVNTPMAIELQILDDDPDAVTFDITMSQSGGISGAFYINGVLEGPSLSIIGTRAEINALELEWLPAVDDVEGVTITYNQSKNITGGSNIQQANIVSQFLNIKYGVIEGLADLFYSPTYVNEPFISTFVNETYIPTGIKDITVSTERRIDTGATASGLFRDISDSTPSLNELVQLNTDAFETTYFTAAILTDFTNQIRQVKVYPWRDSTGALPLKIRITANDNTVYDLNVNLQFNSDNLFNERIETYTSTVENHVISPVDAYYGALDILVIGGKGGDAGGTSEVYGGLGCEGSISYITNATFEPGVNSEFDFLGIQFDIVVGSGGANGALVPISENAVSNGIDGAQSRFVTAFGAVNGQNNFGTSVAPGLNAYGGYGGTFSFSAWRLEPDGTPFSYFNRFDPDVYTEALQSGGKNQPWPIAQTEPISKNEIFDSYSTWFNTPFTASNPGIVSGLTPAPATVAKIWPADNQSYTADGDGVVKLNWHSRITPT